MRLSPIRRTVALAAAVATIVLAVGPAVASTLVADPNQLGGRAADAERLAAQYRGRYQLKLDEASRLLAKAPEPHATPASEARRPRTLSAREGVA